jgi:hypothetical protein
MNLLLSCAALPYCFLAFIRVFNDLHLQYLDYAIRVLMPEIMIKIVMDVHNLSHDEAEKFMFNSWLVSSCNV